MVVIVGVMPNIHDGHEEESWEDGFGPKLLSRSSLAKLNGEVGDNECKDCMHIGSLKKTGRKWVVEEVDPMEKEFLFFFSFGTVQMILSLRSLVLELIV